MKKGEIYGLICKISLTKDGQDLYDHILIVYKTGDSRDSIRFYDPQNNDDVKHFKRIRFNHDDKTKFYPTIFRLDNVDLNMEYLNKISRRAN